MSVVDEFLQANNEYAAHFQKGDLLLPPARKVAVLACMDARLDPARILGIAPVNPVTRMFPSTPITSHILSILSQKLLRRK